MGGIHFIPQLGETDGLLVTDTVAVTAVAGVSYCAIYCVEDTSFSVLTGTMSVQGAIGDALCVAGVILLGNFTAFTLGAGAVIAYKAKPS